MTSINRQVDSFCFILGGGRRGLERLNLKVHLWVGKLKNRGAARKNRLHQVLGIHPVWPLSVQTSSAKY
jgi:hypothetical protein